MNLKNIPVLLLTYRRPETTRQVIGSLRSIRPTRIFFAADAAKSDSKRDSKLCYQVRALIDEIDWPCEVTRRFREKNYGLRDAVNSAIDWFFSEVNSGIILEDDCVPGEDFFSFCGELLEKYRGEFRIAQISGTNHDYSASPNSYRFSQYPHIWGWATWADRWQVARKKKPDRDLVFEQIESVFSNRTEQRYWQLLFDCVERGKIDTWDFSWMFSMLQNQKISITPSRNLVANVGFGKGASHTTNTNSRHGNRPIGVLDFPLSHPEKIEADIHRDHEVARSFYEIDRSARLLHAKLRLTRILPTKIKHRLKNGVQLFNSVSNKIRF